MKRQRDTELELAVDNIVATANKKDEAGHYVHPLMNETNPMILTFFRARDALLDVLKNRPVLFLNLLRTNKTLATFWQEVEAKIWILLLDHLVEMETSSYVADIYPFFVIQNKRLYQELEKNYDDPTQVVNVENKVFLRLNPGNNTPVVMNTLIIGFPEGKKYYIVYYAPVTQFFITILRFVELRLTKSALNVWIALRYYLNTKTQVRNTHVICMADCFLVEESIIDANGNVPFSYDLADMKQTLEIIKVGEARHNKVLLKLVNDLLEYLDLTSGLIIEHPRPVLLDKNTAKPYRDLLFDIDQGLYNTPEKQKQLFLSTLGEVSDDKAYVIAKYGQPLQCSVCRKETNHVDPLLMKAFCNDACRRQHFT